jgi:hypothetical protein
VLAVLLGALFTAWLGTSPAHAATREVKVRWQLSLDRDVAKYRIHRGVKPGVYDTVIEVASFTSPSSGQGSTMLRSLDSAVTYYFSMSAVDSAGQESTLSNEVSIAAIVAPVPAPAPSPAPSPSPSPAPSPSPQPSPVKPTPTPTPTPTPAPSADSDGDGLTDVVERSIGTRIDRPDTDGDGVNDHDEFRGGRNARVDERKLLILLFQK